MGQGLPFDAPEEAGAQTLVGRREAPAHVAFAEGALGDGPGVPGRAEKQVEGMRQFLDSQKISKDSGYKHAKETFCDSDHDT